MNYQKKAFINGKFYTMKEEDHQCEAVVVQKGKFLYCGTTEGAKQLIEKDDIIVDLKGKTVMPGFIDAHQHVQAYARDLQKLNLREVSSLEELKDILKEKARNTPKGELIQGVGFDHEKFPVAVLPTKEDLDEVSPDHPVVITRYCLHTNVANSKALEIGGIKKGFIPSVENSIEFDAKGEPTGRLWEKSAADLVKAIQGNVSEYESMKDAVEQATREFNKYGITSIHPIQGKQCDLFEDTRLYQDLRDEGRLWARVYMGYDELPGGSIRTGLGDDMIKYGFFKIYTDGSLGARSAMLTKPYADDLGQIGVMNHTQEVLNELVQEAYDRDIQIAVHMIGDKAVEMSLTALENCYFKNPKEDIRFRMIHVSLINESILERVKKLPVMCDIQPTYVSSNIHWSDSRVGDRAPYLFAWKSLIDAGLVLTGSSDCPVEPINPMVGIYAVVTRAGYDGYMPEGWHPEQKLTRYQAACLYTKNGAYASFEEDRKGTIEEGKLADFAVLDQNPFVVPEPEILNIRVENTYLGGEEIYSLY